MGDRTANKDGIISKSLWYYLLSSGLPQRPYAVKTLLKDIFVNIYDDAKTWPHGLELDSVMSSYMRP